MLTRENISNIFYFKWKTAQPLKINENDSLKSMPLSNDLHITPLEDSSISPAVVINGIPNIPKSNKQENLLKPNLKLQNLTPIVIKTQRKRSDRIKQEAEGDSLTPLDDKNKSLSDLKTNDNLSAQSTSHLQPTIYVQVTDDRPSTSTGDAAFPSPVQQLTVPLPSRGSQARSSSVESSPSSQLQASSDDSRSNSSLSFLVRERLHSIARDISRRTKEVKKHIEQPPTPDDISLASTVEQSRKASLRAFVADLDYEEHISPAKVVQPPLQQQKSSQNNANDSVDVENGGGVRRKLAAVFPQSFDFQSKKYLVWLALVTTAFIYNAFAVPLRAAYPYQTEANLAYWMLIDYTCDLIYLLDIFWFKPRLRFVRSGLTVTDAQEMKTHYIEGSYFKLDILSMLPLDLLYLIPGVNFYSLVRLPRLLKWKCFGDFFYAVESLVKNPYLLRVGKTLLYMIYLIHCNSCVFYSISAWEGLGNAANNNLWVYDGQGFAYIRCYYFASKVAISIGNNDAPTNVIEHIYMIFSWMMGVFVFALLLGQIRDIVGTANKHKEEFRKQMDGTLAYCKHLKLPKPVLVKVRLWFTYTWQQQKTLDENQLIEKLTRKVKTDLAISVHYHTLAKVPIFRDCDKSLLRDLVLKLKPVLFLPGDFVCRKGEVGKEMYIVQKGVLQVVGGPKNQTVFATLKEGSVFGEISLLSVGGDNRRTADVKSKGFSNLFVLSKQDLHEIIKDYPDAQKQLNKKAKRIIMKSKGRQQQQQDEQSKKQQLEQKCDIFADRIPKLLVTAVQMMQPETETSKHLQDRINESAAPKSSSRLQRDEHSSVISSMIGNYVEEVQGDEGDGDDNEEANSKNS